MSRAVQQTPRTSCILMGVAAWIFIINFTYMLQFEFQHNSDVVLKSFSVPLPNSSIYGLTSTIFAASAAAAASETRMSAEYRPIPERPPGVQRNLVRPGDYIYYQDDSSWDSAPIVLESHKLIFFTIPKVGCTVWKQLFRRMMSYSDWRSQDYDTFQPHNPSVNGLKYLYNYTLEEASEMMTSSEWTRALMVRDPKMRFLSAFLDKAVANFNQHIIHRCCLDESCVEDAQTVTGFLRLCSLCYDDHWRAQSTRLDFKYWPYIDHVGHVETAAQDAKALLQIVGAWDEFGASGWGGGNSSIFESKTAGAAGMNHSTHADWQVWKWYTPETEQLVERFYQGDYENPLFQFSQGDCLTCMV